MRQQMLEGKRPSECEYCWKIEDMGKNSISDRVFKSFVYSDEEIKQISQLPSSADVVPQNLEIAFDRTCNFSCMYCSPSFSTTWANEIKKHGPYTGLETDHRNHYKSTHDWAKSPKDNPYVEAFFKWWPTLKTELRELRITGGEPFLSPSFWRLIEMIEKDPCESLKIAVNSNLGHSSKYLQKIIDCSKKVKQFEIYTSNEAFGTSAEYIRDGLDWQQWIQNMETLLAQKSIHRLHLMMTINGLCLFSIEQLLDLVLEWKKKFGEESPTVSLNILRFPTFQSPLVTPQELRLQISENLKAWHEKNSPLLLAFESESLKRLIDYLQNVRSATQESNSTRTDLEKDLKSFLEQYDTRRQKSFSQSLPQAAVDWLNSI